jgi:uncharacterized coiled-coil protein SlyX
MRNSLFQCFFGEADRGELQEMTDDSDGMDLEIRLAFLEDQLDQLSNEMALQQRHNARLSDELNRLMVLVRPILKASSPNAPTELDQSPPPHY